MNPHIKYMRCLKCNTEFPVDDYLNGCPYCYEKGENANVVPVYEGEAKILTEECGLKRYSEFLPYKEFPSLGEGNTPVVELKKLSEILGLSAVYTKNEFQNPTGSHKDRINPLAVAHAKAIGKSTICCASTGNEAVSCAMYSAAGGLHCVCVSTNEITPIWKAAVLAAGAELIVVEDPKERMKFIQGKLGARDWYCVTNQPDIPIGSPAIEVQGYKTVAYELYEKFGEELPEYVMVPTCRGDLLFGIYCGFQDMISKKLLSKTPKLVAVEPIPRLELVLGGKRSHVEKFPGDTSLMPSVGGDTATYQSQVALEGSGGFAISADQALAYDYVDELAHYGLYVETSSALALACLKKAIAEGKISKGSSVLLVLTSNGFKNAFGTKKEN